MSKRSIVVVALITVVALAGAGLALAEGPGKHHRGFHKGGHRGMGLGIASHLATMVVELELTEEQWLDIRTILIEELPALRDLHQSGKSHRKEAREARKAEELSDEEIVSLYRQRCEVKDQAKEIQDRIKTRIMDLLTDEQKEKLDQMHEKRADRRKGHRRNCAEE
jgi:Spy/CpxP family protein refolding chaperone